VIGSLEMHEALDAHVQSISESVEAAGAGNATWAVPASLGVDDDALMDAAGLWGEYTERLGALRTVEAASCEGFISGFLVAVRVLQARAEA
jgi:hypothetical protein